ncbi:MAG: ABC transporter permease [Lachnospiraceae bacterium]|jgi:spermidine/putrescine transport system permease protein|nr:ABC transporter permease [Lachnospiraceae bacterium]
MKKNTQKQKPNEVLPHPRKKRFRFSAVYITIFLFVTYVPIIATVVYSFNASKLTSIWSGLSIKWYVELFSDEDLWESLVNSLLLATCSSLSATIIGTMGALGIQRTKTRFGGTVAYIALIPIMMPEIILGMVFLSVFSLMGLPFGMTTLVIAHTTFCVPYIYSMVKARLVGMDPAMQEAAKDLGASSARAFFDVTLPLIAPAILSGAILAFAMSFDDVVISIFVTGPTVNTLPIKIYTRLKTGVTPEINALCAVLLLFTIFLMIISNISRNFNKNLDKNGKVKPDVQKA